MANQQVFQNDQIAEAFLKIAENLDPVTRAKELKRAQSPSNQFPPKISALNPQGDKDYPRPVLPYKNIYLPYRAEPEDFTWEELELLCLLKQGVYQVVRNDRSKVQIVVEIKTNTITREPEELWIVSEVGFSNENRALMPPLADYLRQMVGKDKAMDVMTMEERADLVKSGELPVSIGE